MTTEQRPQAGKVKKSKKATQGPITVRKPTLLSVFRDEAEIVIFANAMALLIRNQDRTFIEVDLDDFIVKALDTEPTVAMRRKVLDTLKRCKFLNQTEALTGGMISYTSILQLAGHGVAENGDPYGYFELARGWEGIDTREFTTVVEETTVRLEDLMPPWVFQP